MMKKLVRSFAALMLLASASCAPNHHYLEVKSVIIPTSSENSCKYTPAADAKESMIDGELPVTQQKFLIDNSGGAVTQLSYEIGLTAANALDVGAQTTDPNGRQLTTKDRATMFLNTVEVSFTTVPSGITIPNATIPVTTTIEAGSNGGVVFDMFTKEVSDAVLAQSKSFTILPTFVIKGTTAAGGSVESEPFTFKVNVVRPPVPTEADGTDCGTVAGHSIQVQAGLSCKFLQDGARLTCGAATTTP